MSSAHTGVASTETSASNSPQYWIKTYAPRQKSIQVITVIVLFVWTGLSALSSDEDEEGKQNNSPAFEVAIRGHCHDDNILSRFFFFFFSSPGEELAVVLGHCYAN